MPSRRVNRSIRRWLTWIAVGIVSLPATIFVAERHSIARREHLVTTMDSIVAKKMLVEEFKLILNNEQLTFESGNASAVPGETVLEYDLNNLIKLKLGDPVTMLLLSRYRTLVYITIKDGRAWSYSLEDQYYDVF